MTRHKNEYKNEYDDDDEDDYSSGDVDIWIRAAIKRRARFIQLAGHPKDEAFSDLERVNINSCHLKHLKLSGSALGDKTLKQLSSQCPSLEVLDLKNCYLYGFGPKISSTSLKSLAIVECRITADLTIAAPNLVSLRCVTPHYRAPLFENLGSITTAIIAFDDSFSYVGYEYECKDIDKNEIYGGSDSDSDSDCSIRDDHGYGSETRDADSDSDASTCEYSEIANDYEDKQCGDHGEGHNYSKHGNCHGHGRRQNFGSYRSYHGYSSSNIIIDRSKILGGHNILRSLANATSLELLADAGERILNRELKACPIFINLKTLSLGEWCMAAEFDPLIFFLQHTPNLERLFLELKLVCIFIDHDCDRGKATKDSAIPEGRSFVCVHLKMVKIKCCKLDARVHMLAQLFRANSVPIENIYVRRTRSTCVPTKPLAGK
ncbi:hypothetical protein EJB05_33184 [Eragrostis curvula]|uniref:F-box/LRR-repeat protein 15/At3g58940/PEG3-like LRR domain-containing protein n=1 Tax=Eragrostis curvula TaxID=38414 RepID=A0A5J9U160_9POAL|nr:hypothetical protein EJB05_33184 [Eragrostis curvula]